MKTDYGVRGQPGSCSLLTASLVAVAAACTAGTLQAQTREQTAVQTAVQTPMQTPLQMPGVAITSGAPPAAAPAAALAAPGALAPTDRRPGAMAQVLGRSDRLLVVLPAEGDTLPALAERFLGRADRAFWLGDGRSLVAGQPLVVPLTHPNPTGVHADAYQTVPILSYHRFGDKASKMVVTAEAFEAQLQALAEGGYSVQRLSAMRGFLAGQEAWPARSVVITVDDGHESFYRVAFPLIRKYAVAATLFVPSDAIGTREALTWEQLKEMMATGLVDVQAHSKTLRNLTERAPGETDLAYRRGLEVEVQTPRRTIEQRLPGAVVTQFAYPFGEANLSVLETLQRNAFELGLTTKPGANAFFSSPFTLHRTMVLGDQGVDEFKSRLQVQAPLPKAVAP